MALPPLSSPPLLAFVSGVAWAVISGISHSLSQTEPLQQYYAGAIVKITGGALPSYLIDRAGLSIWISLIGLSGALAVWIMFNRRCSLTGERRSIV